MNIKYLFLITSLLIVNNLTAQLSISAKVVNAKTSAMPFVNVILLNQSDSSFVDGTITNDEGNFELVKVNKGSYFLKISFLGFETITTSLNITESINLGVFVLLEKSESLNEVVVVGRKKLIQRKIDRLVFNVENSSKSSEGDALEVLRITPGVRVQNDRISMIGKNTVSVMVDDKMIKLSGEDLASFLKSIASENIKSIEVITTPPAKYEASGNSGLLNIQLKKAKPNAWNALLRAGYWQRTNPNGSLGGNFNYNKNKLSIASTMLYRNGLYNQEQDDYAYFTDGLWYTKSPFKVMIEARNARLDLNYQISDSWSVGAQYLFNKTNYDVTDSPYTAVFDNTTNEILRSLQSQGTVVLSPTINAINFNNNIKLDSIGKKLTINLDYFSYKNSDIKNYNGVSTITQVYQEQFYAGINENNQDVTNVSATIDIDYPTNWAMVNFGGKLTRSESVNAISLFNSGLVKERVTSFPLELNDFEYIENIGALYVSANKKLSEKWEIQLGLRLEATQNESRSKNLSLLEKNDYLKIFPTIYISHYLNANNTFSINYSKRIDRPQFFDLNPNVYFTNPFQTIEGNPFLQPSFVDNFEFSHNYKSLTSKLYYSIENNLFAQVPLPESSSNIIRFTNENYINTTRFGLSINYMFDKLKWWTSNNSVNVNYSISDFTLPTSHDVLEGINSRVSTNNDFVLNEHRTLLLGLNYWYSFPGNDGIFETKSMSALSVSFQYLMLNKNLSFSVRANDIFKTQADRRSTTINGVFQEARYYYDSQSIALLVSYRFGNKNIRAKRHNTGNQSERNRTGN